MGAGEGAKGTTRHLQRPVLRAPDASYALRFLRSPLNLPSSPPPPPPPPSCAFIDGVSRYCAPLWRRQMASAAGYQYRETPWTKHRGQYRYWKVRDFIKHELSERCTRGSCGGSLGQIGMD